MNSSNSSQAWTNDEFLSNLHRVANPPPGARHPRCAVGSNDDRSSTSFPRGFFIWVNRWKFFVVQVDLMFFLMKEIQNRIATPLFWDHRQSMKWIFFLKKISSIFFHLEKLFYDEVALLFSPCFMQSWMNPSFPTIARVFCLVRFFT